MEDSDNNSKVASGWQGRYYEGSAKEIYERSTDAQSLNQIPMAVEPYEVRESDALQ